MNERPLLDSGRSGVVSLPGEIQFAPNGIVSRTLLRTPTSRVVLFGFAEGQELTEHTSTQEAVVQILSGECEFVLGGEAHHLKPGDLLFMTPHLSHSVRATQQFSMLLTLTKPADQGKKAYPALVGTTSTSSQIFPPPTTGDDDVEVVPTGARVQNGSMAAD